MRISVVCMGIQLHTHSRWAIPTDHFEGASDDAAENVAVVEALELLWELHKVVERVLLQNNAARLAVLRPARHRGIGVQKHAETLASDALRHFPEIVARGRLAAGQVLVDQPLPNVPTPGDC